MNPLRIAIIHHHLRGGGVTRIIEHTLKIMGNYPVKMCVLTGEDPSENEFESYDVGVIAGLSYGEGNPVRQVDVLYSEICKKAEELLDGEPDVWHVHNHTLGKTAEYTKLATQLARSGNNVLYHLHDFCEDNRPSNYERLSENEDNTPAKDCMYPVGDHIEYGLLNGRDLRILKESGIDESYLNLLSNPVVSEAREWDLSATFTGLPSSKKLTLYPVRGIPRKNIGEFVLWSVLADEGNHFAMTLAPQNPKYKAGYDAWTKFTEKYDLPVTFEAGKKWNVSYTEILGRADRIITTSIAEGFGLVFLEAWLIGKPLAGRLIPSVTSDFVSNGIKFPGMYQELLIPLEWIGGVDVRKELETGIRSTLKSYGQRISGEKIEKWLDDMIEGGKIDFGRLSSELQRKVIERILKEPDLIKELPVLDSAVIGEETIEQNRSLVKEKYSLEEYGSKLYDLYVQLGESKVSEVSYIDPEVILHNFLSPDYFSLLRS